MTTPIKIKLSSTVIVLLKWGIDSGLPSKLVGPLKKYDYRVMMVKRSDQIKFFPSSHVFPGGAVDEHDSDPRWNELISKPTPSNLPIKICALREIFEESNFFLDNDKQLFLDTPIEKIQQLQKDLMDKEKLKSTNVFLNYFKDYHNQTGTTMSLDNLHQWARWVTPIQGPKQTHRFDTYFYIKPIYSYPENCKVDGSENIEMDWFSPEEALDKHKSGDICLPPPTWLTLYQLSKCNTLDQVIEQAKNRDKLDILYDPVWIKPSTNETLQVLPGDHLHKNTNTTDKNRIVTRSRINNLQNQFSWVYEYQNTIPTSIDYQYDGASTLLPSKY